MKLIPLLGVENAPNFFFKRKRIYKKKNMTHYLLLHFGNPERQKDIIKADFLTKFAIVLNFGNKK